MKLLSAVLCLTVAAIVAADSGYYVPRSFYQIDENGQRSQTYFIEIPEADVHPRFRRSPQYGFGFQPFPHFGFPAVNPAHGGQFSGVSTSSSTNSGNPSLNSRFGDDEGPQSQGQTTTFHSNNGKYKETTHRFGPDGKVHTYTNTNQGDSGNPDLNSRFDDHDDDGQQTYGQTSSYHSNSGKQTNNDDGPQTYGQSTSFHSNNGKYTHTTNRFGPDGKVHTNVDKGQL